MEIDKRSYNKAIQDSMNRVDDYIKLANKSANEKHVEPIISWLVGVKGGLSQLKMK